MKRSSWLFGLTFAFILSLMIASHGAAGASETATKTDPLADSALHEQFHVSHVVKIYVPSTVNGDIPITEEAHQQFVDQALTTFSEWFGGATAVEAAGAWVDQDNQLMKEKVTIVYSFAEELKSEDLDKVVAYAKQMKKELGQSSVSLEVDGNMYFIE